LIATKLFFYHERLEMHEILSTCRWAWSENLQTPNLNSPVQLLKRIGLL